MSYNDLHNSFILPGGELTIPRSSKIDIWTGTYYVPSDKATNAWMIDKYKKYTFRAICN